MQAMRIRPPAVSGLFYPSDPTILSLQIDQMLGEFGASTLPGTPVAIVSPHAGYAYSGSTAAAAYAALIPWKFDTAVIVSPSHREYFNGVSVYVGDAYRTPLGLLNVDVELRDLLLENKGVISMSVMGHRDEHAIEVQLPFLQRINPEIKILPVVMGDQRGEYCNMLGNTLAQIVKNKRVILIASSDLSHMHPDKKAKLLDRIVADDILRSSAPQLLSDLETHRTEACGGGPIASIIIAASKLGANSSQILHQCTSGDVTGDTSRVVGYLSAAFTK